MLFHICRKCKKLVWFWQSDAVLTLEMDNGRKERITLCLSCGQTLSVSAPPPGFIAISDSVPQDDDDDIETLQEAICPKCGCADNEDLAGFGFVGQCPVCGYCNHPNPTLKNDKWECETCGQEVPPR